MYHCVTSNHKLGLVPLISLIIYRLYFHPISHIPGPPLAKITYIYEWYYDLYKGGQFTFEHPALHRKYGPLLRINPDEFHIDNPYFFDQISNQTNGRVDKPTNVAEAFGPFSGSLATKSHELHRLRRSAVSPFFSKKSVNDLVPVMWKPIEMLLDRLRQAAQTGETLNMKYFYAAVTMDIINAYCFARALGIVRLSYFGRQSVDDTEGFLLVSLLNIHFPWFLRITYSLPDWFNKKIAPSMANFFNFRHGLATWIEAIRSGEDKSHETASHRPVIHELLNSKLPPREREKDRIRDEAFSLVSGGSGTTAFVVRNTAYHIAANPEIRRQLHQELVTAIPDPQQPPSLATLQRLPFLTAVVQEGLRLSDPISHRISRQFPDKALDYHGIFIPVNTTVGMTALLTHRNEELFPEPRTFRPEQWLGSEGKRLDRFQVAFNKGTRSCVGMNLARAELFMILAAVFRQFDFDVSRVKRERDIDVSRDYLLGLQARDTPGVLVKIKDCTNWPSN